MLLSELIKEKTAANHHRLEVQMYVNEIFTRRLSFAQYCNLIQINYAVTDAIENNIFAALPPDLQQQLEVEKRIKLPSLEKDLKVLGLYKTKMHHPHKPVFSTAAEALGGMYVTEGATLGGNVIARRLKEIPDLSTQPFHFYNVYQTEIGERWAAFKQILDTQIEPQDFEQCIAKANETFDFYHRVSVNMMDDIEA